MTKVLMLVADGMGDWPIPELDNQTPMEAAETPAMDSLAALSKVGLCQTIPQQMPPGSDIANMALLGYDPVKYHTGRGPIEAAAQGLKPDSDDLVWRCNLVTLAGQDENMVMRDYSAGHITSEASTPLMHKLQDQAGTQEFTIHPGVQYRHLIVQKNGMNTSARDIQIRPPHDILDQPVSPDMVQYQQYLPLWEVVNKCNHLLATECSPHKANAVWPWGQGPPLSLPLFTDRYGLSGAVISAVDLIKGLGLAAGLKVLDIPGATGLLDTNYQGKAQTAMDFLQHGDFVFVHLEGPDECGHMGCVEDKVEAISRFDRFIVNPLLNHLQGSEFIMIICCDHLTPIRIRTHSRDPVPFLVYSSMIQTTGPQVFSEKAARSTEILVESGHDLLPLAIEGRI
ncbi:cofactor-independent phosphoglycerate mutase [Desulfonatronovibrio magnus]|uniref:cofactor-independent phosphoglycerate mutase n=1 Tax=Desulfonatronovibrio magnus TaxID=698827 RepID=UPI0005EBDFBE|nr:cofactor-independent phosphoglycerate mutase [Desulfonatronovibrio magnus]